MTQELTVTESPIPGLYVVEIPVHGDSRGWFKENWQNEKLTELGFPNFKPVQNNISFNEKVGTTRGIHAEPWDKYVSVANGKVFGAWVDLREGETFGKTFTIEIDPRIAVFVPRGVGNAYQTLEPNTTYTYLVNAHWSADSKYTFLNLADETTSINWPIELSTAELSEKDKNHPRLSDVTPFKPKKTVILGANGQLGKALQIEFPEALALTRAQFDLADTSTWNSIDWNDVDTIINAAAYTKVDEAETEVGKLRAWNVNAIAVASLAKVCVEFDITFVQISSDYVFDGNVAKSYTESEPTNPISVYGQTKAAADFIISNLEKYYIIRTSWIVSETEGFLSLMAKKAAISEEIHVVNDQIGRITGASQLAQFIRLLVVSKQEFGIYNFTSDGTLTSWYELAKYVYSKILGDGDLVIPISSEEYENERMSLNKPYAKRPHSSNLDLTKIQNLGIRTCTVVELLAEFFER